MMKTRLTRLLSISMTLLLLLAAAGPGVLAASTDAAPEQVLSPNWYWESWQKAAQAGAAAAGAGDVDGDGYDDVIVGAPKYEAEVYRGGAAFVFHGARGGLETTPSWVASGEAQGNGFGTAVAPAGDVNCDGYADVIVGAPYYGQNHGKVYLYYGSPSGLSAVPDWSYTGPQRDIWLGWSVATAGDVDGDGCADVLIGAKYYSEGQSQEGAAFLFYGSPGGLAAAPDWTGQINQAGAQFGYALAGAGDINRDGYADVLAGAPYYERTPADLNEGAIFLYYGSADGLSDEPGWMASGEAPGARLGYSVSGGSDLNGDGYPDLAAGAPGGYQVPSSAYVQGRVFAYYGSASGPGLVPDWSHTEAAPYSGYGEALALTGDLNGDLYGDLIVGAWNASLDQSKEGVIYVHHGGSGGLAQNPGWRAEGNKAETGFGAWVAPAGDVNRDGYGDIVVGAPFYRLNRDIMGRAFVYQGFYQEVVGGVIVPIDPIDPDDPDDPDDPGDPINPNFHCYLPVSVR
jgi:hypothetical protein